MKYLIVGLGNIGDEYSDTRHNIGFVAADALAKYAGATFKTDRYVAITELKYKGRNIFLIKPSTFMNLSGKAVNYWLQKESIPKENMLVIVDDIALPLGALRLKAKGHDGGHNGLISIIETINTIEFPRLRIGIGDDFAKGHQVNYVLGRWTKKEEEVLIPRINMVVDLIKSYISIGIERTMNEFNNK